MGHGVWLVTWQFDNKPELIAAVLDSRRGTGFVLDFVEIMYSHSNQSVAGLRMNAAHRRNVPYRAQVELSERITCGHNPHLFARKVSDFKVRTGEDANTEIVSWVEPPIWQMGADGLTLEVARDPYPAEIKHVAGAALWTMPDDVITAG